VKRLCAVAMLIALTLPSTSRAQAPSVDVLRQRVGDYINQFVIAFSNVVAEEDYRQETASPRRKRQLKSDYMLVKYPGADGWVLFRDTFEVDGKPVRTEPERLTRLFTEPPPDALRRGREITSASARYNLVDIGTLNSPLLVLALLQTHNQDRFRYTMGNLDKAMGPDIRVLQFREFRTPTIITLDGNGDLASSGLLWVEQATGRVVKTQLNFGRRGAGIEITTTFRTDPDLGMDVPATMKEWYPDRNGDIRGEATYSRFRRFQVSTEQNLKSDGDK